MLDYTQPLTQYIPAWGIYLLLVWSLVWKGIALWKAARNQDKIWFIVLLVINTLGILEILYIFVFSKREYDKKQDSKNSEKK